MFHVVNLAFVQVKDGVFYLVNLTFAQVNIRMMCFM